LKTCASCETEKEATDFHKSSNRKDGLYPYCKECTREKAEVFRKNYTKPFFDYKIEKGCEVCGYNEHPAALQFDHLDPSQKHEAVATMMSKRRPPELVWEEIKKCRVLCANCHMVHTYG
jgi:protein-arginine kinase activator protein McsA